MTKFLIGEYFEIYQNHETDHVEEVIEAQNIEQARKIASQRFGWGAWACDYEEYQKRLKDSYVSRVVLVKP
jgi:hypothetical protein